MLNINTIKEKVFLNYWVSPFIITVLFAIFALATIKIDIEINTFWLADKQIYFNAGSVEAILSMIGASIITVTAVVFSVFILTLSIASNQLGPRLIPNFTKNGITQMAIGLYIGTFVYVLVILTSIGISEHLPTVSILFSVFFAIACFIVLIYLIHYICQSIQIDCILNKLKNEFMHLIENKMFFEVPQKDISHSFDSSLLNNMGSEQIVSDQCGFLTFINVNKLVDIAEKDKLVIEVLVRPGQFVNQYMPIFNIHGKCNEQPISAIKSCININTIRSSTQDIEFVFEQIAEIAIRALSPSINNPYTAIICIDYLTECIICLSKSSLHNGIFFNNEEKSGVLVSYFSYKGIIDITFDRLRQQAVGDLSVTIKILQSVSNIIDISHNEEINTALIEQARILYTEQRHKIENTKDANDLKETVEKLGIKTYIP